MKVLVIGATGLLGKPVAETLKKEGFDLRLFSRSVSKSKLGTDSECVDGDVMNAIDLANAMRGCEAIHISISNVDEAIVAELIVREAKKQNVKLISYISGCTVCEQNRWFNLIDSKFRAEQAIVSSGIPYLIFRPTWFFDSLGLMIHNGKATLLGKLDSPYHWVSANELARMVAAAYSKSEVRNKTLFVFGPQKMLMKDALEKYCSKLHPEIKKISKTPTGVLKFIGTITRNNQLKNAASLFSYFEKVNEMGDPSEANFLLGKPETTLEQWLNSRCSSQTAD